jgi:hypothetical protein
MVRAATIPTPQIDVSTPGVGRCLRSDLSAASDCDSMRCYDSHERQILSRHYRKVESIIKSNGPELRELTRTPKSRPR